LLKEKNMQQKKLVSVIGALVLMISAVMMVAGCGHSTGKDAKPEQPATPAVAVVPVESVSLGSLLTTVKNAGDVFTLTATVLPANATNKAVIWESSDQTVATVDGDGKVTCVDGGTATITVKTVDGNKTATCLLTVNGSI